MNIIDGNGETNGDNGGNDSDIQEALQEEYEADPDAFVDKWGTDDPDYDPNESGDPHKN